MDLEKFDRARFDLRIRDIERVLILIMIALRPEILESPFLYSEDRQFLSNFYDKHGRGDE